MFPFAFSGDFFCNSTTGKGVQPRASGARAEGLEAEDLGSPGVLPYPYRLLALHQLPPARLCLCELAPGLVIIALHHSHDQISPGGVKPAWQPSVASWPSVYGECLPEKVQAQPGKAPEGVTALSKGVWDADAGHLEVHRPAAKSQGCFLKDLQSQMRGYPPRGFLRGNLQLSGQQLPSATMPVPN